VDIILPFPLPHLNKNLLAKVKKICYTYQKISRVHKKRGIFIKNSAF